MPSPHYFCMDFARSQSWDEHKYITSGISQVETCRCNSKEKKIKRKELGSSKIIWKLDCSYFIKSQLPVGPDIFCLRKAIFSLIFTVFNTVHQALASL